MGAAPKNSVEYLHDVLARIRNLCDTASRDGSTSKHQQIRITHWVRKLRSQPTSNPTWLKSVLEYASVLFQMLLESVVEEPFTKMPPTGPLAPLPRYQVARLAKTAKRIVKTSRCRVRSTQLAGTESLTPTKHTQYNQSEDDYQAEAEVRKVNKQIQTQEQDDQWEWQRVWRGAFDKMHQQLQQKTEETEALATENKELHALVAGYKKALEEVERNQRDVEAKHQAEIANLRAVQSLELSEVQARHRQKLQELALQNDEKLLSRKSKDIAANSADFLQYIDDFYSATLHLTAQNKV